jgi:hypothetical protein
MSFFANSFIFAGIPSETRNLYLGEFSNSGDYSGASSSDIQLLTQKLYRRPIPMLFGAEQIPVLSFPLSVYSPDEISMQDYSSMAGWLFGQQNYAELFICQGDMTDVKINAFLTAPQIVKVGNIIRGINCTVIADAPWGWKQDEEYTFTFPDEYSVNQTIEIFNSSEDAFYTFPTEMVVTANIFGGDIYLTNISDNNRVSTFSVSSGEILTINSDMQLISSNINTYALSQLDTGKWPRLVQGYNQILITGNISSLYIKYPVAVKIG